MKSRRTLVARAAALCVSCTVASWSLAAAQDAIISAPVVAGERLSDWLLRNAGPHADTTALRWEVEAERAPQTRLKQAILDGLASPRLVTLPEAERAELLAWVQAMPVTGRVIVSVADARWLQGNPNQDPVLQEGHRVSLFPRPSVVTLWSGTARPCLVRHVAGAMIEDYLRACLGADGARERDWVWVAQSDGTSRRFGVATWNLTLQDEPGPGAVLWTPRRAAKMADSVSDNLARFLATQVSVSNTHAALSARVERMSAGDQPHAKALELTSSDWGEIGLLQTPSARMASAGDVRFTLSKVAPYTRGTVILQPLDWLEGGFRYTDVSNRLYGPNIAGDQTLKDKSIDIKIRLLEETNLWPQVAFGLRDLGGTGLFSSEYLVANKRWGNWDASLGIGWGYMGSRGNIKNPFSLISAKFDSRPAPTVGQGGTPSTQTWLHGPTAVFGGVQWQSPSSPWAIKLELDGNDYQHEPQANNQTTRSPINFGAVYRYSPNINFSMAYERGNQFMLGLTLHGGLNSLYSPKLLDPVVPKFMATSPGHLPPAGLGNTAKNIEVYTGWQVRSLAHQGSVMVVQAETDTALLLRERIDRAVAVLHQDTPASAKQFVFELSERGLPMTRIEVDRGEWVGKRIRAEAPALALPMYQSHPGQAYASNTQAAETAAPERWQGNRSSFKADLEPSYKQSLGGPDGFLLFQLGVQAKLEQRLTDNTWLSGALDLRLLDNYDRFKYDAPSNLPRVRTYAREYVTTSRLTLPLFQLTHVQDIGNNQYISAYGGMLETMYGGVGAEWLYRPWHSSLAFGVDANYVRQRDFSQNLSLRDYRVGTGHATLYWDTGWNDVQVKLSAGRYLAGDTGATLDVKRVFQNGTAIGAWATKTNVSAEQFGEGSFDKGIYVNIPFDVMLPKSSASTANIVWNPLTRDGGARLNRKFNLFDLTKQRDVRALQWRESRPETARSAAVTSYILSEPTQNIFQSIGSTGAALGSQVADIPASSWLWTGGAVLAASLLDKRVDNWAIKHQTPNWNRVGSVGNSLPLVMGVGTAVLYAGMAGPETAITAETSLKAGAYAMGASFLTRYAVGRARPYQEMGNANFDGFRSSAFQSGFTSNHVSLAFALATPFAQKHNMPWLYGVASLSALGRIQSRDHWLSDTVASAFMGYAIGTLVGNQPDPEKKVRYMVTPQSIQANWSFK